MSEVVGNLIAANETPVEVYGSETMNIDIGLRRLYKVEVLKANVPTAILGLDFLCSNKFILNFKEGVLIDAETNLSIKLIGNSGSSNEFLDCKLPVYTLKLSCNLPTSPIPSLFQLINTFKHLFENPYLKLNSKLKIEQLSKWTRFGNSGNTIKEMNGKSDVMTGKDLPAAEEGPLPERVQRELKSNFPYQVKVKGGPINIKARRLPASLYNKTKAELQKLLEAGVIRRSNSDWGFPINVLRKDETEVRVVADLRQLNAISIRDCYALPNLGDVANIIAKCKIFTKLDLTKAFYNLPLHEESKKYFTINTPFGSFSYNTIVEGHCNSAGAFLRYMHILLADLPHVFVYIDDILIATEGEEEHKQILEKVLERFSYCKIYLNGSKSMIGEKQVTFLGYDISSGGMKPNTERVEVIKRITKPKTIKQLRSFLGALNFFRSCIPNLAHILEPLTRELKGKPFSSRKIKWKRDSELAFEGAKSALQDAVELGYPEGDTPLIIYTDASDVAAAGAIFLDNEERKPLGFYSAVLKPCERSYTVFSKELLAIKKTMNKFSHLMIGRRMKILTDSLTVKQAFRKK